MGYSITTKDGITINNIPDDIQPDDPRLKQRVFQERAKIGSRKNAEAPIEADPLKDMNYGEKLLANVGAGVDSLRLGVQQLFASGDKKKAFEQEATAKRDLDKKLSASTDLGVMPDWVPTLGSAAQTAGEVAPTMVVPFGAAGQGLRMLPNALRTVAGAAPRVAAAGRIGTGAAAFDAAVAGGLQAGLNPVAEGESRGMNMALGAGMGAAMPMAAAVGNAGRRMITQGGGRSAAADQIGRELRDDGSGAVLNQTMQRLRAAQQGDIPLSTAALAGDEHLARLEAGSRARNGANWFGFDQRQAGAVSDAFDRATSEAADLGARRALRSNNYQTMRDQALSSVNQRDFYQSLAGLRSQLDAAMRSPDASNPSVRNMLAAIQGEIDRVGPQNFTPAHLAEIRANLSGKYNPLDPNVFKSAPRDSPATIGLMNNIDEILNSATNNRWRGAVDSYARDSQRVRASQAAGKVRDAYYDAGSGRVRGVSADPGGDIPKITEAGLGRAIDAARRSDKSTQLSDVADQRLQDILSALRQQNIVQKVKNSATAGGGSNTFSDSVAAGAATGAANAITSAAGAAPGTTARHVLETLRTAATARKDQALAEALQNPERMIELLQRKIRANQPLNPSERAVMEALRAVPVSAGME